MLTLDNIEENVGNMARHTKDASKQLTSASRLQRSARKRACWLMLILVIILTVVLIAVRFFLFSSNVQVLA